MSRLVLRLGAFYLFYFASLGALIPYWSLYLHGIGFDAVAIGQLTGISLALRIVGPTAWAWLADHTQQRMLLIRTTCLLAAIFFAGVLLGDSFLWIALVMALHTFFRTAALPLFEANTLNHLGEERERYGWIRLWGSLGFVLAVVGTGMVVQRNGTQALPMLTLVLFAAIWMSSLFVGDGQADTDAVSTHSIWRLLRGRQVLSLLICCFLMQAAFATYYVFFSLHLEALGYTTDLIGWLWAIGVLAEVVVFMQMPRLFRSRSLAFWLIVSILVTSLRWLLIGFFADRIAILLFAQLLHMFSFGVFHAVAIELIHRAFPGRHQGRGQALYSAIGFGAGGAVGSLASGYLWQAAGAAATFGVAAAVTLLAASVAIYGRAGSIEDPALIEGARA
jgi:MFS transporter, PPP family, 3-phenylpropionic acid transporter